MRSDTIVLIGMMGAGKTTLGTLLAARTDRRFLDADAFVEREAGMTIADMFRIHGEAEFRRRELAALRHLAALPGAAVIAAGGGAFCQDDTRAFLLANCETVFLKVPEDELLRRLEAAGVRERPLLARPDWKERVLELAGTRYPHYAKATHTIEVGNEPPETTVDRLAALLQNNTPTPGDRHADRDR